MRNVRTSDRPPKRGRTARNVAHVLSKLPCILVRTATAPPMVLATRAAIAACAGDVAALERQFCQALAPC